MQVNKRTIYSSIKTTEEEVNFCKTLLEIAKDLAKELESFNARDELYEIVRCLAEEKGYIDFDDWR